MPTMLLKTSAVFFSFAAAQLGRLVAGPEHLSAVAALVLPCANGVSASCGGSFRFMPAGPQRIGRSTCTSRRGPALAPAALCDPGHHVLQAHGLAFAEGSYLTVSQGIVGPDGQPPVGGPYVFNGEPIPPVCQTAAQHPASIAPCMAAHGYRGYLTYQPASRFWAFQGIETGIFVVLAAVLLGVTFWVLKRRDA